MYETEITIMPTGIIFSLLTIVLSVFLAYVVIRFLFYIDQKTSKVFSVDDYKRTRNIVLASVAVLNAIFLIVLSPYSTPVTDFTQIDKTDVEFKVDVKPAKNKLLPEDYNETYEKNLAKEELKQNERIKNSYP